MLKGVGEFRKRLSSARVNVRNSVSREIKRSGDRLVSSISPRVPVDDGVLKSTLRNIPLDDLGVRVQVGGDKTTVPLNKKSGRKWDYALGVEYGVAEHIAGGKFAGAKIPAIMGRPFFWPAVNRFRKDFILAMRAAVKRGSEKG